MRTRILVAAAGIVLLALSAAGCSGFTKGKEHADRAVAEFHERFNRGEFEALWDAAGEELKRVATREDFTALLTAVRRKLGDVTGSTIRSWRVGSMDLKTLVALQQDTTFATGKAIESFQFVVQDERATLIGYHITSNDLITR